MVAQVIKLPTTAINNFQSRSFEVSAEIVKPSTRNTKTENAQANELAEQAAQNINKVRDAAKVLNQFVKTVQTNLKFSVDESSGRSVITVTDSETGDIIRQLPAKEVLAVAKLIRESTESDLEKVGYLLAEQG